MDIRLICARCTGEFVANTGHLMGLKLENLPRRCPKCNDEIQKQPAPVRVIGREVLDEWDRVLIAVPEKPFFPVMNRGIRSYRGVFSGAQGEGVCWSGRMDIWDTRPEQVGLGRVRLMRVTHEQAHGESELAGESARHAHYDRSYQYLAIDPCEAEEPLCALVFARTDWKTTVKGRGRQWRCSVDVEDALWSYEMRSHCRATGRFGSRMILAIVDNAHRVWTAKYGDIEESFVFSLETPFGGKEVVRMDSILES